MHDPACNELSDCERYVGVVALGTVTIVVCGESAALLSVVNGSMLLQNG